MFHRELNLENPTYFTEKIQWLKLYDRNPLYTQLVDKYAVKDYVSNLIGEEYIIPTIGVWDRFEDIDFEKLPNQFVLKCTHDSGGIIIVDNKNNLDYCAVKKKLKKCLKRNFYLHGREWPYKNVKPRIIAEKYMTQNSNFGLTDYKFFCFEGQVKCLYVSENSHSNNQRLQFFDRDYNPLPIRRKDYLAYDVLPSKPINFEKMIELAELLSKNMIHVRVDMYEIDGKVYFSEYTFHTSSGFLPFEDINWDLKLGEWIKLPSNIKA